MQYTKSDILLNINQLMDNLVTIQDKNGEYLLHYDELTVDDKSWNVWNWPQGIGLFGIYRFWKLTNSSEALDILLKWYDDQFKIGVPPKNVNTMAPLLTMAYLYEDFHDCRYLSHLQSWAKWVMEDMPRTKDGGLQHMTYGPEKKNQLWDDTLMMTVLPLAKIGKILHRNNYIEEAKRQFLIHINYLMDKKTGLWFHGWTFEENHHYAGALWARGNCWITIAIPEIIEILELIPGDFFREFLVSVLERQIDMLGKCQDKTGLWHTLLLDETSYLESSATAGFAYGILKAIHKGYVDKKYRYIAENAIEGLIKQISSSGAVQQVSVGTGMGRDLEYYRNIPTTEMPYGQSLVILCLTEYLYKYVEK